MSEAPWQLRDWLGRLEEASVVTEAKIAAAVAAEREECARAVQSAPDSWDAHVAGNPIARVLDTPEQCAEVQRALCLEAIRARGRKA